MIVSDFLKEQSGIRHGFFTREGGVSTGLYASLNCGFGSGDIAENVGENRARVAAKLGTSRAELVTVRQVHSSRVVVADTPWQPDAAAEADAIVTRMPSLAIGVLTADCTPILFADPEAMVVAAAHAGWKGAKAGIVDAVIEAMEDLGARRDRICAAIGPTVIDHMWQTETGGPIFGNPFGLGMLPIKAGSATIPLPGIEVDVMTIEGESCRPNEKGIMVIKRPFPGLTPALWGEPERYGNDYWEKIPNVYYTGDLRAHR